MYPNTIHGAPLSFLSSLLHYDVFVICAIVYRTSKVNLRYNNTVITAFLLRAICIFLTVFAIINSIWLYYNYTSIFYAHFQ